MRSFMQLTLSGILGAGVSLASIVPAAPMADAAETAPSVREIEIVVDEGAYEPSRITIKKGERVRLKFVRKEYSGCTRELVIAALNVRRELPPDKPVFVEVGDLEPGEYEFRCGMNMVRGTIVVAGAA